MSDELRFDAVLAIERFFEREDHQHLADVLPHELDASLLPCPELRADVVDDRHTTLVQLAGKSQIEVGEVDEHSGIRAAPLGFAHNLAEAAIDGWNVLDDLDNANLGDLASVHQQLAARRAHLLSADAEELNLSVRMPF